jgi:hypothetical protein
MTAAFSFLSRLRPWLGALLGLALLAGCATRIDWKARVGVYTYDDAVKEFGPPDKSATTSDESVVVEWLTSRGRTHFAAGSIPPGRPGYYYPAGIGLGGEYYSTPDTFLRLTFGPDKKLQAAKRFAK